MRKGAEAWVSPEGARKAKFCGKTSHSELGVLWCEWAKVEELGWIGKHLICMEERGLIISFCCCFVGTSAAMMQSSIRMTLFIRYL